jgi:putative ABC transport system permease protein
MWQELRWRPLRRRPLVAVTVVLTLAVGVGAVTTAFTLARAVLSPLAYPRAGRLVRIYETLRDLRGSPNPHLAARWNRIPLSYLDAADWRRESRTLHGLGLYEGYSAVLEAGGEPLAVSAAKIDTELLGVLGVAPGLGRAWTAREVQRRERLVLVAHELWSHAFGADPAILGRALRLDGQPATVVGVMPRGFTLPGRQDRVWTPLWPTAADLAVRDEQRYDAIARMAPGATLEAARADLERLAARLAAAHPDTNSRTGARLVPLLDAVIGDARHIVALLSAAAVAVLLIACVNLAHLLLAQAIGRAGERALRIALGARRSHLLRQSAVEALPLAMAGGAGGLLLASLAGRTLPGLLAGELPRLGNVTVGASAAAFAFASGLVAMLAGALLPALLPGWLASPGLRASPGSAPPAWPARRAGTGPQLGSSSPGRRVRASQDALVVAEMALTLMLTAAAFALGTSWLRLAAVDPGFDARGVLVQEVHLPAWRYPDEQRRGEFAARLLARLEALPGGSGAALTSRLPLSGPAEVWGFRIAGRDAPRRDWTQGRSAVMQFATAGYLRLLRIPLLAGQPLAAAPAAAAPGRGERRRWVWINHTLAARHWPGASPVGAAVAMQGAQTFRIAGVFADVKTRGLADEPGELMIQPWEQRPPAAFAALLRTGGRPLDAAAAVRAMLRQLDPSLPLPAAARLEDLVAGSIVGPRSRTLLLALSAGVALLLALIGTYGVMAHGTGRRNREIAIRLAAGADRGWVLRWVLRRALALALAGVATGVLGALAAGRLLAGLLYGAVAVDPHGLAAAALLLVAGCLAAAYLPALRASRIDPAAALRGE